MIGYSALKDRYSIAFREGAGLHDVLLSILTASKAHDLSKKRSDSDHGRLKEAYSWGKSEAPILYNLLKVNGWDTDALFWGDKGIRWSFNRHE